ncbi:MAG: hypothetical protein ACE5JE_03320 [Thermoplasmata archaeon]
MRATIKALTIGLLAFSLLLGLGQAMAADIASDDDTDNTLGATVASNPPEITAYDITDAADSSLMHAQLDVNTTYYFNVTLMDPDGWGDFQWANIRIWFDGGSAELTFDQQSAAGANYRVDLNYTNVAPVNAPALSEWSVAEGNIAYDSGSSSMFTNVVNENYTFKLAFSLNNQIRQANDPINQAAGAYNDLSSWNSEVRAKDFGNPDVINQADSANIYHEFGVFLFTNISIGADWDAGTISPGSDAVTNTVTVTHQANRDYRMSVWFNTNLTSGGDEIPIAANVNITAAGDPSDDITSDLTFGGLGIGNREFIWGTGASQAHDTVGDSETTGVQFGVSVPFGTPSGSYVATLTMRVETP